jgi:outer membrane protein assembly factor BamB
MKLHAHLRRYGLIAAVASSVVPTFAAARWPQFRGPNGSGVAENEKPPVQFGEEKSLLWKADMPKGYSSPVVWDDYIFLTAFDGQKLEAICIKRSDGQVLWRKEAPTRTFEKVDKASSLATATPVTDGKMVFVYFGSFGLLAYDFEGNEKWQRPLPKPQIMFGTGNSPLLAGDLLLVDVHVGSETHTLAVRSTDGQEVWKARRSTGTRSYATPVHWGEADKEYVGIAHEGQFTAYALKDGSKAWWVSGLGGEVCSTPICQKNRIILTSGGVMGGRSSMIVPPDFDTFLKEHDKNNDKLIQWEEIPPDLLFSNRQASDGAGNMTLRQTLGWVGIVKGAVIDREKWTQALAGFKGFAEMDMTRPNTMAIKLGGHEDVTQSHVLWQDSKGTPEVSSPLLYKDRIYLVKNGGSLVVRNVDSGKIVLEERLDAPGAYYASPVAADGRVYCCSDRGVVCVVKAGDQFEMLARNELGERIMASPAIVENKLYVRSDKTLWAFGE